jgi:4-aminobutyrate aminotransferase-like enzyme
MLWIFGQEFSEPSGGVCKPLNRHHGSCHAAPLDVQFVLCNHLTGQLHCCVRNSMHMSCKPLSDKTIVSEYLRRTRKSAELYRAARELFPGGDTRSITYFAPYPTFMKAGRGCYLEDADGNRYLDFVNNYFSLIHGHSNPHINEALASQLDRGTAYAAPFEQQTLLAQHLCRRVPSLEKVRFCNSGTEAAMNAVRVARGFTGKSKVLKVEGGFYGSHGRHPDLQDTSGLKSVGNLKIHLTRCASTV